MSDLKILRSDLTFEQALAAIESGNFIKRKDFSALYAEVNGWVVENPQDPIDATFMMADYKATDWQEIEAFKEYDELYFG